MSLWEHHRTQFQYGVWANSEVLRVMAAQNVLDLKCCSLMAHIAGSEWLWLTRVLGEPARMAVWPDFGLDQAATELQTVQAGWDKQLQSNDPSELSREIKYVNSKGQTWTSNIGDILTHVVVHSAYHRGQIAVVMRQKGFDPAYTDFIHAIRKEYIS